MSTEPTILSVSVKSTTFQSIDQSALERDSIIVSAGEVGRSIEIKAQDLADFVQANFADLKESSSS